MRIITFFLCCLFLVISFIPIPGAGTDPLGNLPCDVNLLWTFESYNMATDPFPNQIIWTTILPDGSTVEIKYVPDANGDKYMTITNPDGSRVEYRKLANSYEIEVILFDKDGKYISAKKIQLPWENVLHNALCIPTATISSEPMGAVAPAVLPVDPESKALYVSSPPLYLTCNLAWKKQTHQTSTDWYTTLPDGSYVRYSDDPLKEYVLILEPDGTEIIVIKTKDGGYTITITDKNGKSVTFTTLYSWEYIINDLLCGKNKSDLVHVIYDYILENYKKNELKPDNFDLLIEDEKVSVTLLDDAIPASDAYPKSRGTGVDEGCTHPDLAISRYSVPDMVTAGSPVEIQLTIINTGTVPSGETSIGVRLSQGQTLLRPTEMIPPLQPGEEREVIVTVTVLEDVDGTGIATITLDPDNTEEECNEYNNEESQNVRILSPGISPDDYMDMTAPLPASASSGSGGSGGGGSFPSDTP
jgi:hypothetical protein